MDKLREMTAAQLADKYYSEFGLPAGHQEQNTILAALWFGKRIKYLTEEEIASINEY